MSVPTLNIKDPDVYRLARQLADVRGTSMTAAVREALREALAPATEDRDSLLADLATIGRRAAARTEPWLTDDDLYDDRGLPR